MQQLISVLPHLVDPRGRCNRRGLLIVATLLLGLELVALAVFCLTGAAFNGPVAWTFKLAVCWVAIAGCAKRLHDVGRSAWVMAWALPVTIVWGFASTLSLALVVGLDALVPTSPWYLASLGLTMLPVVAGTLWLHLAKGEAGPNRYGPVPEGLGFAGPHADRATPAPTGAHVA